jgi:two-component system NtrC family sensor kinase
MKLAFKIAVAMTIVIALVLGVDGFLRVQRQLITFENDTRRDHLSMGRATAAAITESWLSYGEALAMDLIDRIGRKIKRVHVGWVSFEDLEGEEVAARVGSESRDKVLSGLPVSTLLSGENRHREMLTLVPVMPRGKVVGAVGISESLTHQYRYVRMTVLRSIATTLMTILICAGATLVLGVFLIGRPIRLLVKQASRIGRGDFSNRLRLSQKDEIADLSREMDSMAEKLVSAIQRIERETKAHLETLDQLRHADRLKTVGQLTSGVVHEIGTPLTVISGRAKMIESAEVEEDEAIECARIIVQQADRVTGVVRQILDFARKTQNEPRFQNIVPVVEAMVRLLQPVAVKTGIYLDFESSAREAHAKIDASQIQQVLANLIINGIQAGSSGGRVTVSVAEESVLPLDHPDSREPTPHWVVAVRDEGCGIPEEAISRIFESFYTTKTSGDGTGLGLAISKEIVREHGGWLAVDSTEGEGSTFKVYLPREKAPS